LFQETDSASLIPHPLPFQKLCQSLQNEAFCVTVLVPARSYLAFMRFAMVGLSAKKTLLPQKGHFIPIFLMSNSTLLLHWAHLYAIQSLLASNNLRDQLFAAHACGC
jgi:hypothetical protein